MINRAIGFGANPVQANTADDGGGGPSIPMAKTTSSLQATSSAATAPRGRRRIFFVVDNNQDTLTIKNSTLHNNPEQRVLRDRLPWTGTSQLHLALPGHASLWGDHFSGS
jgi:hypothetical protein